MSALAEVSGLLDADEYRLTIGSGVVVNGVMLKGVLRPELDALARAPESDRADALRRVLISFRAARLILRSCLADTIDLTRDFESLREIFEGKLPDDAAWPDIDAYLGPSEHRVIVARAWAILEGLGVSSAHRRTSGLVAERVSPRTHRPDLNIVAINSQLGRPPLLFEYQFVKEMVEHWRDPSLVSTSHVIEALRLLQKRVRVKPRNHWARSSWQGVVGDVRAKLRTTPELVKYVFRHYREPGGFCSVMPSELPDLYGTRSAIVIYKTALDIGCEGWLGSALAREAFPQDRRDAVVGYALGRLDAILSGAKGSNDSHGALRGGGEPGDTIIDLFHATYIVRNLEGVAAYDDDEEREWLESALIREREPQILDYVARCRRSGAFVLSPSSEKQCLTACIFAHRSLYDCNFQDRSLMAHIDRCAGFVRDAFSGSEGGFGSAPDAAPDMIHTYLAITLDRQRGWKLAETIGNFKQKTERFLAQCSKAGGYALAAELKPSAYGTRLALQILDSLSLPLANPERTREFLESLGDQADGYRGHHEERPLASVTAATGSP